MVVYFLSLDSVLSQWEVRLLLALSERLSALFKVSQLAAESAGLLLTDTKWLVFGVLIQSLQALALLLVDDGQDAGN